MKEYRQQVVQPIDEDISKKQKAIDDLRSILKTNIEEDPSVPKAKTGGKTLKLPDIATVSLTKEDEKVKIVDPVKVMGELGSNYQRMIVELDAVKAKRYILESGKAVAGSVIYRDSNLVIRFNK
jgi:hypothetical protein